jgi:hypothetical protein
VPGALLHHFDGDARSESERDVRVSQSVQSNRSKSRLGDERGEALGYGVGS